MNNEIKTNEIKISKNNNIEIFNFLKIYILNIERKKNK